jgi:DNA helicase-2/ATP-dependent DNA helicase PcrA
MSARHPGSLRIDWPAYCSSRQAIIPPSFFAAELHLMSTQLLDSLNPVQQEAVLHTDGPLLILAGAGSGKTRVLTHRVAYLIERGVPGGRILAVTFTNKAAREMKERIRRLVGHQIYDCWIGTFHATCARILRQDAAAIGLDPNFVVCDDADQVALVKECLAELDISDEEYKPRAVLSAISRAKEQLLDPDGYRRAAADAFEEVVGRVYRVYQEKLAANRALDFDDLIAVSVRLLKLDAAARDYYQEKFQYVLVDEYQDINHAQYELIKLIVKKYRNICCVGDDDQSVYSWRGADVRFILAFERDYPDATIIKLEQNYRSTQMILDAAHSVVRNNLGRTDKKLWTEKTGGELIQIYEAVSEQDEADYVAMAIDRAVKETGRRYDEFAILYRTNAQSRIFEEMLLRRRMPYRLVGGPRFYERREVKDLLSSLRLIINPFDTMSLRRVINSPPRGIGAVSLQRLDEFAAGRELPLFQVLEQADEVPGLTPRVRAAAQQFAQTIRLLQEYHSRLSVTAITQELIDRIGYIRELQKEKTLDAMARIENLEEFTTVTREYDQSAEEPTLAAFLEHVALMSDADTYQEGAESVTLMTLHAAKGLEFSSVFLVGLEEGIFPHSRSMSDAKALEEERRLCYVGITRAEQELTLTYASRRTLWGSVQINQPSRFLREIPDELFHNGLPVRVTSQATGDRRQARGKPGTDDRHLSPVASDGSSLRDMDMQELVTRLKSRQAGRFQPGDRVRHPAFGEGIVVKSRGTGDQEQVSVLFPVHGERKFLASLARLDKCP